MDEKARNLLMAAGIGLLAGAAGYGAERLERRWSPAGALSSDFTRACQFLGLRPGGFSASDLKTKVRELRDIYMADGKDCNTITWAEQVIETSMGWVGLQLPEPS